MTIHPFWLVRQEKIFLQWVANVQKQIQISGTLYVLHLCFGDREIRSVFLLVWAGLFEPVRNRFEDWPCCAISDIDWARSLESDLCHLWAVSAVDLGCIPLASRVNAKAMEKKKPQDRRMLWEEQVHVWWSACQWSTKPHKSSSITSDGRKGWVAPRPSPQPSHSHVYLSVIHALERRLLMPCLWFITYHVLHRFSQWGDPKQMRKNKSQAGLTSGRWFGLMLWLLALRLHLWLIHQSCR